MNKIDIVRLGQKFDTLYLKGENEFNTYAIEQYSYKGKQYTRKVHKLTEKGQKAFKILTTKKVFICPQCKELQTWNSLENWLVNKEEEYINNLCICSCCYENNMGEDL